jgi:probable rRNA maturation factor
VSRARAKPLRRRRTTAAKRAPLIDILVQSPRWKAQPRAAALVRQAIAAAAKTASTPPAALAIVLTDDSAIRVLNRQWRKRNEPTNVLSFPARIPRAPRALPRYLGDIVVAFETTANEAAAEHKSFGHHLVHLAIHGYLHLLGYDHATDRDANEMERLEISILARLNVPDPYCARDRV